VAEGAARDPVDAQRQAEAVALKLEGGAGAQSPQRARASKQQREDG
jgi:hypothetical protein